MSKKVKMKKAGAYLVLLCLQLCCNYAMATITVTSVTTTISTCPNNGTATIHAKSTRDSAVFLYNITTGTVTYPQQNDSTFSSLYPGNYIAWVHDINSFDSTEVEFSITGNYVDPIVSATASYPLCDTGSHGQIIGNLTSGSGLAPYRWQIFIGQTQQHCR